MRESIPVNAKKAGRPAGRDFPVSVQLRLTEAQANAIDNWRRAETDIPSRSEAIRRLVEEALKAKQA
jgi:hypothetical protein